jgi:hypothetical protein
MWNPRLTVAVAAAAREGDVYNKISYKSCCQKSVVREGMVLLPNNRNQL